MSVRTIATTLFFNTSSTSHTFRHICYMKLMKGLIMSLFFHTSLKENHCMSIPLFGLICHVSAPIVTETVKIVGGHRFAVSYFLFIPWSSTVACQMVRIYKSDKLSSTQWVTFNRCGKISWILQTNSMNSFNILPNPFQKINQYTSLAPSHLGLVHCLCIMQSECRQLVGLRKVGRSTCRLTRV